jgi:EF-P beta-lysylation protein EpmB
MNPLAATPNAISAAPPTAGDWQSAMRTALRDPAELCEFLGLSPLLVEPARRAAEAFGLFVPRPFAERIERGNPADPLLRQVLPLGEELTQVDGFSHDPVGDLAASPSPGFVHKYRSRVLLITTGACPVHCRYCFRRHYPYGEAPHAPAQWEAALAAIAADESIDEVILSGGDPLTLVDARLAWLAERLAEIPHVVRLRVHTRMPIMIPARVTDGLVHWLTGTRLSPVAVIHANHANELDADVAASLEKLSCAGVVLLNQAVLLRGVNDRVDALADLSRRLIACRVTPYYLHQLDRVSGAAHFEVAEATGVRLIEELRRMLPGYLVPRYVREVAGDASKEVIA